MFPIISNNKEKRQPPRVIPAPSQSAIVKALNTLVEEEKARRNEQKADEKRWWPPSAGWAIVYVTIIYVFVAWFQLGAIRRQGKTSNDTLIAIDRQATAAEQTLKAIERQEQIAVDALRETRKSVDAAQKSAKAAHLALKVQRPYVYVENQRLEATEQIDDVLAAFSPLPGLIGPNPPTQMSVMATFEVVNRGKGVAIINDLSYRARISRGPLAILNREKMSQARNINKKSTEVFIRQEVIDAGQKFVSSLEFKLSKGEWSDIHFRYIRLCIVIGVRYSDVSGTPYPKTFRLLYEPPSIISVGPLAHAGFLYAPGKKPKRNKKKAN